MKLPALLLTLALTATPCLAQDLPPSAIVQQPSSCPSPVPVCNTPGYSFTGPITPTKVAQAVAKCINWREGSNGADKDQCFGAFQDVVDLQDCDAIAFNYLLYNPNCTPKPDALRSTH